MAEAKSLERLKAMRSLLKSEMEKSETFSLVLHKTGSKIEEINHKLLSLEADVKVDRWRSSLFSDHIRHTIGPISAVLRVFALVQELEKSLMSSNGVFGYISDVKRLGEAMKLLSNSCVLALNWLDDTIKFLTEKGMPEDHPCGLRFKTSIEQLQHLQMTETRAYLRGGSLYTALKNLEKEFERILKEEQVLSEGNLRKLQAIIKRLDAHTRLTKCVHEIEGDIDQWRLHMEIAVKEIYEFESKLCYEVFEDVGEDVPLRCFGEIASNSGILSLLRFGSRISKCKKDPPKLLKLLDCFSCQVELQRPNSPPLDGGVPRLVSVVTEYCNKLRSHLQHTERDCFEFGCVVKLQQRNRSFLHLYDEQPLPFLRFERDSSWENDGRVLVECTRAIQRLLRRTVCQRKLGKSLVSTHQQSSNHFIIISFEEVESNE